MSDPPHPLYPRVMIWLEHRGWSHNQFRRGVLITTGVSLSGDTIGRLRRDRSVSQKARAAIIRFLSQHPRAASFDEWMENIGQEAVHPAVDEWDELCARRRATEDAREARRLALLAQERAAFTRRPAKPDFIDGATVRALSGGTMTSLKGLS